MFIEREMSRDHMAAIIWTAVTSYSKEWFYSQKRNAFCLFWFSDDIEIHFRRVNFLIQTLEAKRKKVAAPLWKYSSYRHKSSERYGHEITL